MSAGLQVFADNAVLQIDSDYRNARVAQEGYCNNLFPGTSSFWVNIAMNATTRTDVECPVVVIKPEQTEKYVGGCFVHSPYEAFGSFPARPYGAVQLWGGCPFHWAVFSTQVALTGGSPFGLDVFDANGALVFASAYRQLRVTETFDDANSLGWPKAFSLTRGQVDPWIWVNPMIGISGGPYDEVFPGIAAKFNAARTQMTVAAVDLVTMSVLDSGGNPFQNQRRLFGTAAY